MELERHVFPPPSRAERAGTERLRVLHVTGSPTSRFHHDLALVYTRSALLPAGMAHRFAVQDTDGRWRLGGSLDRLSDPMPLTRLVETLGAVDLVVPYQFCPSGMSANRTLFEDTLGIPVVGSPGEVCALATDKAATRRCVAEAGVRVARAVLIEADDARERQERIEAVDLPLPLVVKPNREDNSVGLRLVRERGELADAVDAAAEHDAEVLVETFVPGREIRVALVELDGEPFFPAMLEYTVTDDHPLRDTDDKLALSEDGNPISQQQVTTVRTVCPAQVDEPLAEALRAETLRAHRALGCRDYSLFDFRVHEDGGEPYLLEAGLFWTFGEISIVSRMIAGGGDDAAAIAERVWRAAAARGARRREARPRAVATVR